MYFFNFKYSILLYKSILKKLSGNLNRKYIVLFPIYKVRVLQFIVREISKTFSL